MSRSTLGKSMSVGRATALVVGLATMAGRGQWFPYGVSTQAGSQPTMTAVTASGSGSSSRNVGVLVSGGVTTMTDVTASASGSRNPNTAVEIEDGSATIRQSKLSATGSGQNLALASDGGSAKVAVSQLVGGVQATNNSLQCFDNYDENLNTVNCRSGAGKLPLAREGG